MVAKALPMAARGAVAGAALALLLATCALPATQSARPIEGPPALLDQRPAAADEVAPKLETYQAADGTRLPLRVWPAQGGAGPKQVILGLHGFNDYGNMFAAPGAWWAARGVTTYAFDQRGFGVTQGAGIWAGSAAMAADVRAVATLLRRRHPGVPLFVVGESMGGAVALVALAGAEGAALADGLILSAPALRGRETLNPFYRASLWLAVHVAPQMRATGRGLNIQASDNIEMLRGLGRDPWVIKATRFDTVWGLVDLMDIALAEAPRLALPTLVLYGKNDQLIPAEAVALAASRMAPPPRIAWYDRGWHMLLRDLQAEIVWADILAWTQGSPLPSSADRDGAVRLAAQ